MRAHFSLLAVACLLPALLAFVVWIPHIERPEYDVLLARETSTAEDNEPSNATVTDVPRNSTRTDNSITTSATTVPALNTSVPEIEDEGNSTAPGELPLKPAVTPALGVGGFILLATGSVLALIGVRNLWVHVFLSSAFLTSLGVTVLIIYVMNPPVRVAIQGAYLVAIFFTGITFGGLAIVFKELAEGLGCLLGGFCTSMWLLSTRSGGLLQATDAKAGFIGAISVGFYAVSFSHYTRPYGLIVATSIAGGTAFSLGIDCYSKAGLKEFWLYLWALNDDIFPLGTDTYPVTRYIKVELAVTVIVAVMGVISQLRLWKIVRERRAKEEEKRQEEQRQKDEAEAEVAKRLEAENEKERMEWEAKYGDHEASESSSTIPELAAGSQTGRTDDGTAKEKDETNEKESISDSAFSYRCSDCRARGDDASSDATGDTRSCSGTAHNGTDDANENRHADPDTEDLDGGHAAPNPLRAAAVADDRRSDMTAVVGSETVSVYSKRLSMLSREASLRSAKSTAKPVTESQEALITHDDDGTSTTRGVAEDINDIVSDCDTISMGSHYQAMVDESTVVAEQQDHQKESELKGTQEETLQSTANDQPEKLVEEVSAEERTPRSEQCDSEQTAVAKLASHHGETKKETPTAPQNGQKENQSAAPLMTDSDKQKEAKEHKDTAAGITLLQPSEKVNDRPYENEQPPNKPTQDNRDDEDENKGKSKEAQQPDTTSATQRPDETPAKEDSKYSKSSTPKEETRSSEKSQKHKKEPERLNAETVERIPKHTSRIVQAYRMNEWAKHLADADAPEPEPIHSFEDERPKPAELEEAAAPVNVPDLLQTPLNAQPPPAVENRASLTNDANDIYYPHDARTGSQKKKRRSKSPKRLSGNSVGSAQNFYQNLPPVQPQPQPQLGNIATQSSVTLLPAAEQSPEEIEKAKPRWKGPAPLIAVREDMMRSRLSFVSLPTDAHARHSAAGQSPDLTGMARPSSTFPIVEEDDDDIPLSQRRTMLHQQSPPVAPTNANAPAAPPPRRNNSGAPSRANSPAVLAAWRESVREDLKERRDPLKFGQSSTPMSGDRSASSSPFNQLGQCNVSSPAIMIGDKIAEGMQRGDMSDLHREAMRRMQAQANRSVNRLV
ncbi:uncharacterized protein BDV17DRAFT_252996 [Aspergillus undulatus]|uniref:uncharacterized protein n=1 Tax=Aspergillus undulatus TaxID=1810928 RepID=UPI003CCE2713